MNIFSCTSWSPKGLKAFLTAHSLPPHHTRLFPSKPNTTHPFNCSIIRLPVSLPFWGKFAPFGNISCCKFPLKQFFPEENPIDHVQYDRHREVTTILLLPNPDAGPQEAWRLWGFTHPTTVPQLCCMMGRADVSEGGGRGPPVSLEKEEPTERQKQVAIGQSWLSMPPPHSPWRDQGGEEGAAGMEDRCQWLESWR